MDSVKEAFHRVRQDIDFLKQELHLLREGLTETRMKMIELCEIIAKLSKNKSESIENSTEETSTHNTENATTSTHNSTHNEPFKPLKPQNISISIGNEGVSTDRQTDRQTDKKEEKSMENNQNALNNAVEILNSLDNIKKEIRLKFKRITNQELLIFSTIYQLDEEKGQTNYKDISQKLNLSESSIRDYVQRLIKKGIPVEKTRINNKSIVLNISQNLKKIASLSTILKLKDL